jgi:peptidoglycan/xylan/chitin deacetylase (PgdA/CDA1 family)
VTSPLPLSIVMYHYIRDLPRTPWPRLKGMLLADFRRQVETLQEQYELATLAAAIDYLHGRYRPRRPLCLLTFDDALREHYTEVTPILRSAGVQGLFMLQTGALEGRVAAVHKNHFLLAALPFEHYERAFLSRVAAAHPTLSLEVDADAVASTYRWDTPEVARFKYLLNFRMPDDVRERILDELFTEHFGDQLTFSRELYLQWEDAREMQRAGMVIGGHSHGHAPLTALDEDGLHTDLATCARLLHTRLDPQDAWPFSYPYGRVNTSVVRLVRALGFSCAFTTEVGPNAADTDVFRLRRIDPKDVTTVCTVSAGSANSQTATHARG